ncbi:MAG: alpha/beta hydrolase domain-containing protein [Paracraurococcus sp.]
MRRLLALLLLLPLAAEAQVSRFEITGAAPAFGGREFGAAGRYERLTARATIAVDPADPRNAAMADIALAPRNAAGRVEAVADVVILRPVEAARGNGTLLLEVPNRGRKLDLPLFNDADADERKGEPGNGFLYAQGFTLAWVGWQGDFVPAEGQLGIAVPRLAGVTGAVREDHVFDHARSPAVMPLFWAPADPAKARLTVRDSWDAPRQAPADMRFRFTAAGIEIDRPAGFGPSAFYELVYDAKDPAVLALGFAAVRDVAAFLRHAAGPENPLAGRLQRSLGFGISQSGRFLRDFLYLGFNEDVAGRAVFDGLMPHIAGSRRLFMNTRWARPDKAPRHPQDPAFSADAFPFAYQEMRDPFTGTRDGLLKRCTLSNTCPRVMQTDTEYEWWGAHASLLVTDPADGHHLDLPAGVRAYMVAGAPHFAMPGDVVRRLDICAMPLNPTRAAAPARALLLALDAWVRDGTEPPASRVPTRAAGTLVPPARAVPEIPGLPFTGLHVPLVVSDQGVLPPREIGRYPVFAPLADPDGMAVGGIRQPGLAAPLATWTAWNPRPAGFGPGLFCPLQGSVLPFAATEAERRSAGDPRPSLAERWPTPEARVAAVRAAAEALVAERLLLPEDAAAAIAAVLVGRLP